MLAAALFPLALAALASASGDRAHAAGAPLFLVATPDPEVRFHEDGVSLLVSQVGYADPGVRAAFLAARDRAAGDAIDRFTLEDARGHTVHATAPVYAGCWQGMDFWRLDLSSLTAPGTYRIRAGSLVSQRFPVATPRALWLDADRVTMMTQELAARRRTDGAGGYADCGNDFRETHALAAALLGLLDALELERDPSSLDEATRREAETHVDALARFVLSVQDPDGRIRAGFDPFGRVLEDGEWPNHLQGARALLRVARHRRAVRPLESDLLLEKARLALRHAREGLAIADSDTAILAPLLLLEAEWVADPGAPEPEALERARAIARALRARQLATELPADEALLPRFPGLLRERTRGRELARLNEHGPGSKTGACFALPIEGLTVLLERAPGDRDAPLWAAMLDDLVAGFVEPAAALSPFGLVANGVHDGGVRWFSDLYHGMSVSYALAAAALVRYAELRRDGAGPGASGDPALLDLAERQLLWVGGLNTGYPFPEAPEPFSCLAGRGYRALEDAHGPFARIPGAIVNGLSATPAFDKRLPDGPEAPAYVSDESWIAHTGAWLSATARLVQAREASARETSTREASARR